MAAPHELMHVEYDGGQFQLWPRFDASTLSYALGISGSSVITMPRAAEGEPVTARAQWAVEMSSRVRWESDHLRQKARTNGALAGFEIGPSIFWVRPANPRSSAWPCATMFSLTSIAIPDSMNLEEAEERLTKIVVFPPNLVHAEIARVQRARAIAQVWGE